MSDFCPDPMVDYEGYHLWCEMNACTACDGVGGMCFDDDDMRACDHCDGTGIEPYDDEGDDE